MTTAGKQVVLAILTVAVGFANAYLWNDILFAGGFREAAFYSLPVLALLAFAALFALSSVLIRDPFSRSITAVLALGAGFAFAPYSSVTATALGLSAIGGWYAASAIAGEAASTTAFSMRRIFRGGLPVFFTAVALLLSTLYFGLLRQQAATEAVPKTLFDALIPLLEKPLQPILPGFRSDAAVDELLLAFAGAQAGINPADLLPAERETLIRESRDVLERDLGIALVGTERGGDLLYRIANAQIKNLLGPFAAYLPFLAAFGFFVTVKAFTLPVYWLTLILVSVVVKFLLAAGWLRQHTETITRTRLTL